MARSRSLLLLFPLGLLLLLAATAGQAAAAAAAAAAPTATATAGPAAGRRLLRRSLLQTFFGGGANGADTNGMFDQFGGGMRDWAFTQGYPGVLPSSGGEAAAPLGGGAVGPGGGSPSFEWPTQIVGGGPGAVVPAATVRSGSVACGTVGLAFQDVPC